MTDENIDMLWNTNKDLSLILSCIKIPLWNENQENFENKCLIREILQKCSGGKIIGMLKKILSNEEKTALVKTQLDSFFQNQTQYFENHMKMKSEIKMELTKIKTEPINQPKEVEQEFVEIRFNREHSTIKQNSNQISANLKTSKSKSKSTTT